MHPAYMHSVRAIRDSAAIKMTISELTISESMQCFPTERIDLVAEYSASVDYLRLAQTGLQFDRFGDVTNPQIRQAVKEALISSYCSREHKTALLRAIAATTWYGPIADNRHYLAEFERLFNEIAQSGYLLKLDGVDLSGLTFAAMNWSRASLRDANLTGTAFINMDLSCVDLTGAVVDSGQWLIVNASNANVTGVNLEALSARHNVNL